MQPKTWKTCACLAMAGISLLVAWRAIDSTNAAMGALVLAAEPVKSAQAQIVYPMEGPADPPTTSSAWVPTPPSAAAIPSLEERARAAVESLAAQLSRPSFDLKCWDSQARTHAERLGIAARGWLAQRLADDSQPTLQLIAVGELLVQLSPAGREASARLSANSEASMLAVIRASQSQPRLAAAAARTHLTLGSEEALAFWITAASETVDTPLAQLSTRAFSKAHCERVVVELVRALRRNPGDAGSARLVQALSVAADEGALPWFEASTRSAASESLDEIVRDARASPTLRAAAERTLAAWAKHVR
jgi:hypothetical protein